MNEIEEIDCPLCWSYEVEDDDMTYPDALYTCINCGTVFFSDDSIFEYGDRSKVYS